jgi:hypothetical protein
MRGPWSAFSRSWIGGDDPSSDGVYASLRLARYAPALPFRERQPASASGGDAMLRREMRPALARRK